MPYRIDFENDAAAQVPAQHVRITNQLDSDLDWSSFALTEIGFGDELIAIPEGSRHFQTTVAFTYGGASFDVLIEAGVNAESGLVFASFQSIDPATSLPPSVLTGFLPPEDGTGRGLGHVSYTIRADADAPTGTALSSIAIIQFDGGEIIATNQVDPHDPSKGTDPALEARNTIDADRPSSIITTAPGNQARTAINLSFQSQDVGAGVSGLDVFVSEDSGAYVLALSNVTTPTATYIARSGHTYQFYSIARDHTGNLEAAPASPDTMITLAPAQEIVLNKQRPKFSFTDDDGSAVTVTWSGLGTATLQRFDDAVTHRGDLVGLAIAGSDGKSALTITSTKGTTTIGDITSATPLAALTLKGVDLLGDLTLNGAVPKITLGNLADGADITLSGVVAKGGVKLVVGDVAGNSDLASASPIASLSAVRWTDGSIAAPSIGALKISGAKKPAVVGDFGADLTLSATGALPALKAATIAGTITGGAWDIAGSVGAISALSIAPAWSTEIDGAIASVKVARNAGGTITAKSIGQFTVGGDLSDAHLTLTQEVVVGQSKLTALTALKVGGVFDNSEIISTGHLGAITAGAIRGSRIFAGVDANITDLPEATSEFSAVATIASITTKGIKGSANAFADSRIAASQIGAITLRDIAAANGGESFGIAATRIAALTAYQGKDIALKLKNFTAPAPDYTIGDFVLAAV